MFGLQWREATNTNGECFYGNDTGYNKYGTATNCAKLADNYTYGGSWSNAVYKNN